MTEHHPIRERLQALQMRFDELEAQLRRLDDQEDPQTAARLMKEQLAILVEARELTAELDKLLQVMDQQPPSGN